MDGSQFSLSDKIQYLQSVEKAYGVYSDFSIYDIRGIKIGDTRNSSSGADASTNLFFTSAAKGAIYYDSVPVSSNDINQYILRFSGPLHDDSGRINGVLVGSVPLGTISDIVVETSSGIGNATADLVSSDGLIIYSNHDDQVAMHRVISNTQVYQKIASSKQLSEHLVGNEPLVNQGNGSQAIYVAVKEVGFLDFKGNGWILILAVPTDIAFHEVTQLRTNFIILATVILSASIIAVVVFSNVFTKPLIELKNAALQIAGGNFDLKARIHQNDEIGELSEQFDKMRIELKDRERMKDEFINIAAHELRSPLQPIISYTELALKGLMDKDEALQVIDGESQRFIQLANDILDVSRIESGVLSYQMQKVKLADVLSRVVDLMNSSGKIPEGVSLQVEYDQKSRELEIEADANRLGQVFTNIVGNAIKFTKKGMVKIESVTHLEENSVEIRIIDTGGGIPAEIFPKLFGKFVTKSVKGGTEHGTGLGLFISKAITSAHGGEIHAQNNEHGGATFIVILPIKKSGESSNQSTGLPPLAGRK